MAPLLPTSCRLSSAKLLPGGCTGSTPAGNRQAHSEGGAGEGCSHTALDLLQDPCPRSLRFRLAATKGKGQKCIRLHPLTAKGKKPRGMEVRLPARGHSVGSGKPRAQAWLPHGLDGCWNTTPAAGVSYRSPGVGRAPGTRPAFVDQLRADAVATWKAAEDGELGASVTAAAHKAGRAFWNPASALRVPPSHPSPPQSRPQHTQEEESLETDVGKGSRASSRSPSQAMLS